MNKSILSLSIIAESPRKISFRETLVKKPTENSFLVKTIFSGISAGTERKTLLGEVPSFKKHWNSKLRIYEHNKPLKKFPTSLGYETIGRVIAVGDKVNSINVGDLVWVDDSHSEYNSLKEFESSYMLLPKNLDPKAAVFLPLSRVALGAVHDGKVKVGDLVVVIGQGIVGSLVAQIANLSGAKVIVVDKIEERLKISRKLGFETINISKTDDPARYLREEMGYQNGADVVFESSGSYLGLTTSIRMSTVQGVVVTVGSYPTQITPMNLGEEWQKNKISLISSMTINGCTHSNYPLWNLNRLNKVSLSLLSSNKIKTKYLISHVIPFKDAQSAYKLILNDPPIGLKIVLSY